MDLTAKNDSYARLDYLVQEARAYMDAVEKVGQLLIQDPVGKLYDRYTDDDFVGLNYYLLANCNQAKSSVASQKTLSN